MKKLLCLLAALAVVPLAGCNNVDPAVQPSATTGAATTTTTASADAEAIPAYIDADALAHRSYELRYLLAQTKFESPDDMSVNALVQFAFCHMFYENLTDMPRSGNQLRQASKDEIEQQILKYFGAVSVDVTKADLYNHGRKCFEMWEPLYGRDIFYKATVTRGDEENQYVVNTVFYSDASQSEVTGRTTLTVEDVSGQPQMRSLTSSN